MAMRQPENAVQPRRDPEPVSSDSANTWGSLLGPGGHNGDSTSAYSTGDAMQQQSANNRPGERAAQLSSQSMQALSRFMQYQRRFDRRRENLSALKLDAEYEKEKLRYCEIWRRESCETVSHEIHDAVQRIREARVMDEADISLHRLEEALKRLKQDGEEVSKQERALMKSENKFKHAQGKLSRVIESMMTSARTCIELSDLLQTDSLDMISNSTINASPTASSQPTQKPPALIEKYYETLGQKNYLFERLAEIEFARREEMINREVMLDQADPQAPEPEEFREQDEAYMRERLHAEQDYDRALADFNAMERQCRDNNMDPEIWRTSRNTQDDEEDDDENDTSVGLQRPPFVNLPETVKEISDQLTAATEKETTAIGPVPDDPAGLLNTEVYKGGPNGNLNAESKPVIKVVDWMQTLPDQTRSRVHSASESPVPMQADRLLDTTANTSTRGLLEISMADLDAIDIGELSHVGRVVDSGLGETSEGTTMSHIHTQAATDSVVGESRAEPHSKQIKNLVIAAIDDLNEQANSMHIVPTLQQYIAEQALESKKSTQDLPLDAGPAAQDTAMDKAEADNITRSVADQLNVTSELYQGKESWEDIDRFHDAVAMAAVQALSATVQTPRTPATSHHRSESGKHQVQAEHATLSPTRTPEGNSETVRWAQDLVNEHSESPVRASPTPKL